MNDIVIPDGLLPSYREQSAAVRARFDALKAREVILTVSKLHKSFDSEGKTTLALGNISGAMMIQATVPSALGLLFTPWLLDKPLTIAAGVTFASIALMWLLLRWRALTAARLSVFGLLYLVFVGLVVYL